MEWKEEGLKAIYIGGIAWLGALFVKKVNPLWKSLKRGFSLSERVDNIEQEILKNKRSIAIEEAQLMALIHISYEPIFIIDTKGNMTYANPAWQKMTGWLNINDAYQKGYMLSIPAEDQDELERVSDRIVEHPSSYHGIQKFKYLLPPYNIITAECRTELVKNEKGELVKIIGRLKIISE